VGNIGNISLGKSELGASVDHQSGKKSLVLGKDVVGSNIKSEDGSFNNGGDNEKFEERVENVIHEGKGQYVVYVRGGCESLKKRVDELKEGNGLFKDDKVGLLNPHAENFDFTSDNVLSFSDAKTLLYKEQKYHHTLPDTPSSYANDVISNIIDRIAKRIYKSHKGVKLASKFPPSLWFRVDDTHVSVCSYHDIRKSQVYLLCVCYCY
jgi:hypothetical protein